MQERQNQNEEENSTLKGEEVGDYNVKFDRVNGKLTSDKFK